mgnify:FL=1|jgi:hypothetical protein|tara:strand:+ start:1274 stop:1948 length:675 start_codon:yes stop_codon:yes gene_type:complete
MTVNVSQRFLDENSVELADILSPYLTANQIGLLSTVCRAFGTWASGARRPKLGLESPWVPYGNLGRDPVMAKKRVIKLLPRMYTVYANPEGYNIDRNVQVGSAIDPEKTRLNIDLLMHSSGEVVEHLYNEVWFSEGETVALEALDEPKRAKFKIKASLSSYHQPVALFRLRFTLTVTRTGHAATTDYVYDSPAFFVVTNDSIPKPGTDADLKRRSQGSTRGRFV